MNDAVNVLVLPEHAATAQSLWDLERTISAAGAEAHLLVVPARDAAQESAFRALFDRDFDGATFTHVGDKVTFEVVAESFGLLQQDPALRQLAALVHCIDVGGIPVDEAPGIEMFVFDAVYAAMQVPHER